MGKVTRVSSNDITGIGYQLPMLKDSFVVSTYLKSVKGLPVVEMEAELDVRTTFVKSCMRDISINFLKIGKMLAEIQADFDFTKSEYLSFYTYCNAKFDLGKTTVFNLINVYCIFAEKITADEKYSKYTYTQLVELLPLAGTDNELKVSPEFTISQIRAFKKEIKRNQKGTEEVVRKKDIDEERLSDKIVSFDDVVSVRRFLADYAAWEVAGEVLGLGIIFYRCYLNDGEQQIELIAEEIALGKVKTVYYHKNDCCKQFFHLNWDIKKAADDIYGKSYIARLIPFDDKKAKLS